MNIPPSTYQHITADCPLYAVLSEIVDRTFEYSPTEPSRPWLITFTAAYNGLPNTALCELCGSPVRATILVHFDRPHEIFILDSGLKKPRKKNALFRLQNLFFRFFQACAKIINYSYTP